jgi:hypothetical protein
MNGDGLLLLLGFSDLHDMDPLVIVHVLAIRLGIDLVLEEPDILEFGGTNPGGGGGGRVEEGGQGGFASIFYRRDQVIVQVSFRVLVNYVRF